MNMFEIFNIIQIDQEITLSDEEKLFIDNMPESTGSEWNDKLDYNIWKHVDGKKIEDLKVSIKKKLKQTQGLNCAFCGMKLKVTSSEQIEHIAPKGKGRYPK